MERLYEKYDYQKDLFRAFQNNSTKFSSRIDSLESDLQQLGLQVDSAESEEKRKLLVLQYANKRKVLDDFIQESNKYTEESRLASNRKIFERINKEISEYALEKGISIIVPFSGNEIGGFCGQESDKTEELLNYLNDKYQGK
jgi:Skp family chaperone for outer membrane proteins